ncbi:MAG: hypothetical protein CMJ78_04895 [Planctomycetaceae bacterium]|nr:hypothetical protein [Planctomycetaceae bacterium]
MRWTLHNSLATQFNRGDAAWLVAWGVVGALVLSPLSGRIYQSHAKKSDLRTIQVVGCLHVGILAGAGMEGAKTIVISIRRRKWNGTTNRRVLLALSVTLVWPSACLLTIGVAFLAARLTNTPPNQLLTFFIVYAVCLLMSLQLAVVATRMDDDCDSDSLSDRSTQEGD